MIEHIGIQKDLDKITTKLNESAENMGKNKTLQEPGRKIGIFSKKKGQIEFHEPRSYV